MIKERKYGRKPQSSTTFVEAPYVIKIGFNQGGETGGKKPGKLPGFLICHNSKAVGSKNYAPAFAEMERLGYSEGDITKAMELQLKAEAGKYLPLALRVVIPHNARLIGEGEEARWAFPGTYVEEYQLWGKQGYQCHGDGETAERRQADHTFKTIACRPIGVGGLTDDKCCKFSVDGTCRSKSRWIFKLFYEDDGGVEKPLSPTLKWGATYKLDTTSEYAAMNIIEELTAAAERLDGKIGGLTGVLFFGVHEKRHSKGAAVGKVGQIRLHLDEAVIERRESGESERILAGRFYEDGAGSVREVSKDPSPQPEREEERERGSVQEPANTPAPDEPEHAHGPEREKEPHASSGIDLSAMSDERMLEVLREYVDSRSGSPGEVVWFNRAGKRYTPGFEWFLSGEGDADEKRRGALREICNREFATDEFIEWAAKVGGGVS